MPDKTNRPAGPAEEKATPPPDDPGRRSAEWEELEQTPEETAELALLRLKALQSLKGKTKP